MLPYDSGLKGYSRRLRTAMTDAEQRLWYRLRRKQIHGVQFYRQKPLARYIVDFHAPAAKLVVELDGSQHGTAAGRAADMLRDAVLARMGMTVLRFDNLQVLRETDAVLEVIRMSVKQSLGRG